MLIKRVKFSNISTKSSSVVSMQRIRFYNKDGGKINFGKVITNSSHTRFETEFAYLDSMARYDGSVYDALHDGYFRMDIAKHDARSNFQIVFKEPQAISKFELDTAPLWLIHTNIKAEFYNINDELVKTYIINLSDYEFSNKGSLRLTTIPTPELAVEQRYFILSEKKANGVTKSFTIEKKEVSAIPLFFEDEFDNEINNIDANKEYSAEYPIEHVFKNNLIDDFTCAYQSADRSYTQLAHPSIKVDFKEPRLINAVEIQSSGVKKNAHIRIEGYDEINKEWNQLSEYKAELLCNFSKIRMEFDTSEFYFSYRITFVDLYNEYVLINDIKLIEYQSFLKEVSISSPEDYKRYGMRSDEYYCTSNVLKKVVQKDKTRYGSGNIFSKLFDNKNKEIKSITI